MELQSTLLMAPLFYGGGETVIAGSLFTTDPSAAGWACSPTKAELDGRLSACEETGMYVVKNTTQRPISYYEYCSDDWPTGGEGPLTCGG